MVRVDCTKTWGESWTAFLSTRSNDRTLVRWRNHWSAQFHSIVQSDTGRTRTTSTLIIIKEVRGPLHYCGRSSSWSGLWCMSKSKSGLSARCDRFQSARIRSDNIHFHGWFWRLSRILSRWHSMGAYISQWSSRRSNPRPVLLSLDHLCRLHGVDIDGIERTEDDQRHCRESRSVYIETASDLVGEWLSEWWRWPRCLSTGKGQWNQGHLCRLYQIDYLHAFGTTMAVFNEFLLLDVSGFVFPLLHGFRRSSCLR